jgi:hypothetical protein
MLLEELGKERGSEREADKEKETERKKKEERREEREREKRRSRERVSVTGGFWIQLKTILEKKMKQMMRSRVGRRYKLRK